MKKKIKSAVISIAVIAVLLLSILIGVKNGTLDKLTKEMPTLETKQEETKKSAENESQKNESSNSVRIRNSSRRDIANVGQQFELRNNDVKYTYDEIVGYITKGRGVSVHRKDCTNIKDLISEENRMIDVEWYKEENKVSYQTDIEINSNDRAGLLVDILKEIGSTKAQIRGVNTKVTKEKIAIIDMTLEVENLEELNKAIKVIRKVDSVYEVKRKK